MTIFARAAAIGFVVAAATVCADATTKPALRELPAVTTVAGTGAAGFADGTRGSFLMPAGIAYDALGRLYVADAAAQRIRRVERTGAISTVAGGGAVASNGWWVPGAYGDGVGSAARFNDPQGIAIRRDGSVYVADSLNHCIREITAGGVVTTYAGSPNEAAHVDGPGAQARFVRPTGLAVDQTDNLYVADYSGIRRIDAAGNVSTLTQLGVEPYAVAVIDGPLGVTVFAGDRYGIVARHAGATDPKEDRRFVAAHAPSGITSLDTNGDRPLGNPAYMTALDENTVAFTDARTNTVRLLETVSGELKIIAGIPADDASGNTGGYRNGIGPQAKFFAPLGIARAPDGALVVADSGNRILRQISAIDRVDPWSWLDVAYPGIEAHPRAEDYRIAFVGNSYIWYDTGWSDSIEGLVQSRLASNPYWRDGRRGSPRVIPIIKYSIAQVGAFLQNAAESGLYRMVVLDLNWGTVESSFDGVTIFHLDPARWQDSLAASLSAINRRLQSKHIPFLVVTHPVSFEVSPSASLWLVLSYQPKPDEDLATALADRAQIAALLRAAVVKSGVPALELGPSLQAAERGRQPPVLFGSGDYHFTRLGRSIAAKILAAKLEALAPWRSQP